MKFVNRVADVAEREGHHPDIAIHWNKVDLDTLDAQDRRPARERLHRGRKGQPAARREPRRHDGRLTAWRNGECAYSDSRSPGCRIDDSLVSHSASRAALGAVGRRMPDRDKPAARDGGRPAFDAPRSSSASEGRPRRSTTCTIDTQWRRKTGMVSARIYGNGVGIWRTGHQFRLSQRTDHRPAARRSNRRTFGAMPTQYGTDEEGEDEDEDERQGADEGEDLLPGDRQPALGPQRSASPRA